MVFLNQVTCTLHKNVVSGHINLYLANSIISISHQQLLHKNGLKMFPYPKWKMPNSRNFVRRHYLLFWVPRKFIHYIGPQFRDQQLFLSYIPNTRWQAMIPQLVCLRSLIDHMHLLNKMMITWNWRNCHEGLEQLGPIEQRQRTHQATRLSLTYGVW